MTNTKLDAALDLMRRLPPQDIEQNLQDIIDLDSELCDDLLAAADQPLKVATCTVTGRDYLLCDSNRDGDSFRSPWSNEYDPPLSDGYTPSEKLRNLEVETNKAFDIYRDMYFGGGISSAYLWDMDQGFAAAILIKKNDKSQLASGCWDSSHIIDVKINAGGKTALYKLTSTIMLWLKTHSGDNSTFDIGGSMTRIMERTLPITNMNSHILNFGPMVEDIETQMRGQLTAVYFGNSQNIINTMRCVMDVDQRNAQRNLINDLSEAISKQRHPGSVGGGNL